MRPRLSSTQPSCAIGEAYVLRASSLLGSLRFSRTHKGAVSSRYLSHFPFPLSSALSPSRRCKQPITTAERAALFVNLANVNALQKDFARAKKFAEQALSLCPALPAAVRVLVYIELQKGNDVGALQILRKRHATTASGKQTRGR